MLEKLKYLATCARKTLTSTGLSCPSCGHADSTLVARKYAVTALRRCSDCHLLFRTPTTTPDENASFYQVEYTQGFTTDCPSDEALAKYLETGFANSAQDNSRYIDVLRAAGGMPRSRVFDFGCSWGYGSWQLQQAQFDVEAYEISVPRARYASDKLAIKVHSSLADVVGPFDIFFSAHVLEHVPSVKDSIEYGMSLLKPGGLFVAFTPNGSSDFCTQDTGTWNKLWGSVHPNFLDDKFYRKSFAGRPFFISSGSYPLKEIEKWANGKTQSEHVMLQNGSELLLLAKKPSDLSA